jgi:hypothetical protein
MPPCAYCHQNRRHCAVCRSRASPSSSTHWPDADRRGLCLLFPPRHILHLLAAASTERWG